MNFWVPAQKFNLPPLCKNHLNPREFSLIIWLNSLGPAYNYAQMGSRQASESLGVTMIQEKYGKIRQEHADFGGLLSILTIVTTLLSTDSLKTVKCCHLVCSVATNRQTLRTEVFSFTAAVQYSNHDIIQYGYWCHIGHFGTLEGPKWQYFKSTGQGHQRVAEQYANFSNSACRFGQSGLCDRIWTWQSHLRSLRDLKSSKA